MDEWIGWTMSRSETKAWLAEAHKRRLNEGRKQNAVRRKRIAAARAAGREWQAELLSRQFHRKSVAFARAQRQREEAERERDRRRVGAAVRRTQRELDRVRKGGNAPLFEFDPARAGPRVRAGRDLYWEWISRGFEGGRKRNYKKSDNRRIRAREAKWTDGEFQDKIVYIEREDALEDVPGNIVSNMGVDQAERLGCAGRIEELERLSRKDAGVYVHSILALPADLSPEGRAGLLRDLCRHYERLRLPHCAALHKPDPDNSQKNFHAHILVNLRPMERVADQWEFAATKLTWLGTPAGLRLQRRVIARAFNKALEAEKVATRWTHRSRAADGLAPAGFTKRGGVNRAPRDIADIDNVLLTRAAHEEAQALDQAVGCLERIAVRLVACETGLETLGNQIRARTAIPTLPQRDHAALEPVERKRSSDRDASESAADGAVANSQPAGPPRFSGGVERTPAAGGGDLSAGADKAETEPRRREPVEAMPPVPPTMPVDLEERRRRRLAKARQRIARQAYYMALGPGERSELDAYVEAVALYLANGSVVVTADEDGLSVSASAEILAQIAGNVASSQHGWQAVRDLAEAIDGIAPTHHYPPQLLSEPADDWSPGFDPRSWDRGG